MVACVVKEVEKLSVKDGEASKEAQNDNKNKNASDVNKTTKSDNDNTCITENDNNTDAALLVASATELLTPTAKPVSPASPAPATLALPATTSTNTELVTNTSEHTRSSWKRVTRHGRDGPASTLEQAGRDGTGSQRELALGKRAGYSNHGPQNSRNIVTYNKKKKMRDNVLEAEGKGVVSREEESKEATSPGATGQLTGASVSACQKT